MSDHITSMRELYHRIEATDVAIKSRVKEGFCCKMHELLFFSDMNEKSKVFETLIHDHTMKVISDQKFFDSVDAETTKIIERIALYDLARPGREQKATEALPVDRIES